MIGKNLIVYSSQVLKKYSTNQLHNELDNFLRQFQLNKALSLISNFSLKLFNKPSFTIIKDVPVSESILAYVSLKLIESSNDYRSKVMSIDDLIIAIDMYWGLPDPCYEDGKIDESLIRLGMQQFDYDREKRNSLARTLFIYRELWNTIEGNSINIQESIQGITKLTLEEVLLLSYWFTFTPQQTYFQLFDSLPNENLTRVLELSKQQIFVNWLSCNYQKFRDKLKSQKIPSPQKNYEKYRFNPLSVYPIIIPDRSLIQGKSKTFIVPIKRFLYERVTKKIYFDLSNYSDFHRPSKENIFRAEFGKVFEKYIGVLLKKEIVYAEVLGDYKYGSSKLNKRTSDWIVLKNNQAILIEIKQSCLYLGAKTWGNLAEVKDNLRNTISSAVEQLQKFERDIRSGDYQELHRFANIDIFEKLIITYDHSYFLNSLFRELIKESISNLPQSYYWHVISVEDFENILGLPESNLFKILEGKRLDEEGSWMDFRDYIARKYKGSSINLDFLDSIDDDFFSSFGIEVSKIQQKP